MNEQSRRDMYIQWNTLLFGCFSPVRLFATPWTIACQSPLSRQDFPGKNTGAGCHFLLWHVFPTQGLNPCLLHWQVDSLPLNHQQSPAVEYYSAIKKNEPVPSAAPWMDIEMIVRSEVSHKEKGKSQWHHLHVSVIQPKYDTNELIRKAEMDSQT